MATDQEWARYTDATFKGKLTGNAEHARKVKATPLEADAILRMVWDNVGYFGDSYYNPLTRPVEMRVEEYLSDKAGREARAAFKPIPIAKQPMTFKIPNEMLGASSRARELTDEIVAKFNADFEAQCKIAFDKGPDWLVGISPMEMSGDFILSRKFAVVQQPVDFEEYEGWSFYGQGARA